MDSERREFNLRDYLSIARRRWLVILTAFVAAFGGAVGMAMTTEPLYEASAAVTIDKSPLILLKQPEVFSPFADQTAAHTPDITTLAELIRSETVREGTMTRLGASFPAGQAASALQRLRVQPVRNAEIVRIYVQHTNPEVAAAAANAVIDALVDMDLRARRRAATETRQFIGEQLSLAGERLRANERALVEFQEQHGDVSLAEETSLFLQQLADLRAELVDVRLERRASAAQIMQGRSRLAREARVTPTQWTPSPLISALQAQLATLGIERSGLRRQFTVKHPAVLSTDAKIEETKRRLDVEVGRSLQAGQFGVNPLYQLLIQQVAQAEVARAAADARERALLSTIEQYEARMKAVPTRSAELTRVTRQIKEAEEIYLLLSERFQEAQIAEASIGSAIRVVDAAKLPSAPARTGTRRSLMLGAIVGLMLGLVGASIVEQFDESIRSAEDVERLLGAPVLGTIPLLRRTGSQASEAYRALRTRVLHAAPQEGHRVLLVTSALPGEGKSAVALELARAIAHAGRKVWLLDCDLRRAPPGTTDAAGNALGLTGFLAGKADVGDVVRPTTIPLLWHVASGRPSPNSSELLSQPRMAAIMAEARTRADVSLVDGPAVLPTTDAEVLGEYVDGALLVVRLGETKSRALAEAARRLERMGVRIIGAALNFVPRRHLATYASNGARGHFVGQGREHVSAASLLI